MFSPLLIAQAEAVLTAARVRGISLITAESCTGGLIAALLTEIAGASDVVLGGLVTYANEAKMELLGIPQALIEQHGAVSEVVAKAMSEGAVIAGRHLVAEGKPVLAVAVTGIAGPGGGSPHKPVGTVHLAVRHYPSGEVRHVHLTLQGDRHSIRMQTVAQAMTLLQKQLEAL